MTPERVNFSRRRRRAWKPAPVRRRRQVPPLTAGTHEVEEAVQQGADACGARPPTGLSGRDQRFKQPELVIRQSLTRAEVSDQCAISERPHGALQAGNRPQRRRRSQDQAVKPASSPLRKRGLRFTPGRSTGAGHLDDGATITRCRQRRACPGVGGSPGRLRSARDDGPLQRATSTGQGA